MLIVCDKRNGQCHTFTDGARVGLQVFGRMWTLFMCVKTIRAVTAACTCLFAVVQCTDIKQQLDLTVSAD